MVELIAPVLVAELMGERLRGKKLLIFVDSELEDMSELTVFFFPGKKT